MRSKASKVEKDQGPKRLRGFAQGVYILNCIDKGMMQEEIVGLFGGDKELVDAWRLFFIHNKWLIKSGNRFRATGKGEVRIREQGFT